MTQQEFCRSCGQKNHCQEVYQHLGNKEGPSIISRVIVAFLLPMMVFIAALAASEAILAKVVNKKELQIVLSLLLALAATAVFVVGCWLQREIKNQK